ncbi:hypothetical protein AAGW18_18685 [Vreelandella titanicae]|uniref:hypothetical protein n=1 Tax=Vreelandella titanicae TaxID=664683 RepID=UPI00241D3E86|nr:hypothetical protein [Halomonas titanicae]
MSEWDDDISALDMSDVEKNGLQVYRNYTKAFERDQAKKFAIEVNSESHDVSRLSKVCDAIACDDERLVPLIACAFADEALDEMYKREVPKGIPGGRDSLFSGYGPFSSLSKRIQVAYAFGWMSEDILKDMDSLRKVRNKFSHLWDHESLSGYAEQAPTSDITPIETMFKEHDERLLLAGVETLDALGRLRIRTIWLLGRLYYESLLYPLALKRRLQPYVVLYGEHQPDLLSQIAGVCSECTRKVLKGKI